MELTKITTRALCLVWWKMKEEEEEKTQTSFSVGSEVSKMRKRETNVEF